jgi:putative transposase
MLDDFSMQAKERCEAWGGRLVECNGEADHVHLLVELPPTSALADFVNALKTGTSRRLRNEYGAHLDAFYSKPVLWSRSYCVLSCGGAPLEIVKQYIQQQARPDD